MKIIDSHCHLDFEPLSLELGAVVERAYTAGVDRMINVGASLRGSEKSVAIANNYPNIWASIGLHPHEAETILDIGSTIERLRGLAKNDKVVAIGEIGLDYYPPNGDQRAVTGEEREKQKELFSAQLELANELQLPVIFHVRDAWEDFFKIIQNKKDKIQKGGVLHCYTGDEKIAKRLVGLGFYIGFTGLVTFKNANTAQIKEAAKIVPLDKILVETDAPFLAPEPHRGKTNEPAYVLEVAKKLAEIKGVSLTGVAETTTKNAEKLFGV
jgi:TatD DNase family protein